MTSRGVGEWTAGEEPIETIGAEFDTEMTRAAAEPDAPEPRFATLPEFVEFAAEILWTDVETPSKIWCPEWWRHTAAIVRLDALHRAFEQLRLDPGTGVSTWLRDHADYHLGVLTDPNGPLKGCSVSRGHDHRDRLIKVETAPTGLFESGD